VRDGTKADAKKKKSILLVTSHSTFVLKRIAIAAICNKLPWFLIAMCVKVRYIELRYATEDYKASFERQDKSRN
jgi:hypothetical protein